LLVAKRARDFGLAVDKSNPVGEMLGESLLVQRIKSIHKP